MIVLQKSLLSIWLSLVVVVAVLQETLMRMLVPLAVARQWGLYVSTSRGKTSIGIEEPALFSEPAVYLVRPDGTLYYGAVQTMPFARPHFDELIGALDFAIKNDYPARGEYTGTV